MASQADNIIPFPREAVRPVFLRSESVNRLEAKAVRDAQAITAAKRDNNDWTANLLLSLLEILDRRQLELLEFRLLGRAEGRLSGACQALAIVQLAAGDKAHRERVKSALARLHGGEQ